MAPKLTLGFERGFGGVAGGILTDSWKNPCTKNAFNVTSLSSFL